MQACCVVCAVTEVSVAPTPDSIAPVPHLLSSRTHAAEACSPLQGRFRCALQGKHAAQCIPKLLLALSLQGKREEGIDWRPTLQAMRLTPPQAAAIVDARAQVTVKLDE